MSRSIPPLPYTPLWRGQGQLRSYVFNIHCDCYFASINGVGVHVFPTQIVCCRANHTAQNQKLFLFCFTGHSSYESVQIHMLCMQIQHTSHERAICHNPLFCKRQKLLNRSTFKYVIFLLNIRRSNFSVDTRF
jgi:hypothetical protein